MKVVSTVKVGFADDIVVNAKEEDEADVPEGRHDAITTC